MSPPSDPPPPPPVTEERRDAALLLAGVVMGQMDQYDLPAVEALLAERVASGEDSVYTEVIAEQVRHVRAFRAILARRADERIKLTIVPFVAGNPVGEA